MASPLPEFFDAHFHFLDPEANEFQSFLRGLGAAASPPATYDREVLAALAAAGVPVTGCVHVEALPDVGREHEEVAWVESLIASGQAPLVKAIVGACDLSAPDVAERLDRIIDYDGPFKPNGATHVACTRHNTDYLRGGDGGGVVPEFEAGFAELARRGLSFEVQCAPEQLAAAAELIARHPDARVCVDHLGKPRLYREDASEEEEEEEAACLARWRDGMRRLAALPHGVVVKLSMPGYAVPDWFGDDAKTASLKQIVKELIEMFGAERCMVASNFHINAAVSDSDHLAKAGPTALELVETLNSWFVDFGCDDAARRRLFGGTAKEFYRI